MLAQRLRHQVTIEQRSTSLNAYQENVAAWSTLRTIFAGVEPVSGKETAAAGATQGVTLVRFVVRWDDVSDVTTAMRISFDGKYYDIVEVINEITRNRMGSLVAGVGANRGGQ